MADPIMTIRKALFNHSRLFPSQRDQKDKEEDIKEEECTNWKGTIVINSNGAVKLELECYTCNKVINSLLRENEGLVFEYKQYSMRFLYDEFIQKWIDDINLNSHEEGYQCFSRVWEPKDIRRKGSTYYSKIKMCPSCLETFRRYNQKFRELILDVGSDCKMIWG